MNKELPCYIVTDLIPLYQDEILSNETKEAIDKHLQQCDDCRKKMDIMEMQVDVKTTKNELKGNPLMKVRFYQKILTVLGAIIAFVFGAAFPIARLGIGVLMRGGITDYQIERLKNLWYILTLECCFTGIVACMTYLLITVAVRKIISKKKYRCIKEQSF